MDSEPSEEEQSRMLSADFRGGEIKRFFVA